MKLLLTHRNLQRLAQLARSNVLLAFDYDGTLAPIVADRELAMMRDTTLSLFQQVCLRYPCAVISGRAMVDVGSRLGNARVRHIVGNHGLEPGDNLSEFASEMTLVRPLLEPLLARYTGVELEDKLYSLAIHYRHSRQKRRACSAIHDAVAAIPFPLRIVPGKQVLNLLPARATHKGKALMDLGLLEATQAAFYVGDDVTDEDVFQLDRSDELFTVRVGRARRSAAKYFLRDQYEMDVLLARLIELRSAP